MKRLLLLILVSMLLIPSVSLAASIPVSDRIIVRLRIDAEQYDLHPQTRFYNTQRLKGHGKPISSILIEDAQVIILQQAPQKFEYTVLFDSSLTHTLIEEPRITPPDAYEIYATKPITIEEITSLGEGAWPILFPIKCYVPAESARYAGYAAIWLLIGEDAVLPHAADLTFGP